MAGDSKLRDDEPFPRIGEVVLERYTITRLAGEGGFARVYEARDSKAGGRVALKVLDAEKSLDVHFAKRFQQEVRIVRELRHPNTIKIWDVGVTKRGLLFAVMEYAEGEPLHEVLGREGSLSAERATHITEQILKGLAEAHVRGIVHRDLKPENILLCEVAGEKDFVKILDFGIAKSLVEDLSMVKTQTGMVMGTPGYAAPEVLMGAVATPAADVYAAGLIYAEMLTGRPVIQGESIAAILMSQIQLRPHTVAAHFTTSGFRALIERALAVEPEGRYRNTGEMLAALRESCDFDAVSGSYRPVESDPKSSRGEANPFADTVVSGPIEIPDFPLLELPGPIGDGPAAIPSGELAAEEGDGGPAVARGLRSTVWLAMAVGLALVGVVLLIVISWPDSPDITAPPEAVEPGPEPASPPPPVELAVAEEPERDDLPVLPGPAAESLSWDWLAEMGGGVDPVAVLTSPSDLEEPPSERSLPEVPRRLIAESARLNAEAVEMLEAALRDDRIEPERVEGSRAQLVDLYDSLLVQLVEAKMCRAAKTRLEHARQNVDLMAEEAAERLEAAVPTVEMCDERAWIAGSQWDAARFLSLIRAGGDWYEAARAVDPPDPERRDRHLTQSLADYELARDMLLSARAGPEQPGERLAQMEASLRWLDARIVAILCALDKCSAAELHLEQAISGLPVDATDSAVSAIRSVEPAVTACKARSAVAAAGFDWPLFLQLVELSAELYSRAVQLLPPPPPTVHRVRLRITSRPSGAGLTADGERLGETPYDGVLETENSRVTLTLSRDGYHRARFRFDADAGEVERHLELEPDLPFGRVHRLGDD